VAQGSAASGLIGPGAGVVVDVQIGVSLEPADGVDHKLVPRPELGAQSPNVHVDRTRLAGAVVAPCLLHQPGSGECLTGMLHKEIQQFELGERQIEVAAAQRRGETGRMQKEVAELQGAVDRAAPAADRKAQPGL
jgi:hypothetical protein